MSTKNRMALGVSPLFLRVALAVTFIWAGMGKLRGTMEVDGETAAVLANMGVIKPTTPATGTDAGKNGGAGGASGGNGTTPEKPLPPPTEGTTPPPQDGSVDGGTGGAGEAHLVLASLQDTSAGAPAGASPGVQPPATTGQYTAADFPDKVTVKPLYTIASMLHAYAHPKATPENPNPKPLWPPALASGRMPVILAWLVTIAELGGGVLVAIGLCTRLAAFSLAFVMAGAMWLTQIGPAVVSGKTILGFLPEYARYSPDWQHLLFQFILFAMAMALFFSGPGYMAADHALFGAGRKNDDHDGE